MARKLGHGKLHFLTVREVQSAPDGDRSDGGGLILRVRGTSASWVLRYTSPAGRRREMGLGVARRGSSGETGESLTLARRLARMSVTPGVLWRVGLLFFPRPPRSAGT
jgi:hypothetical protein